MDTDEMKKAANDMAEYQAADVLVDESKKAAKNRAWMWVVVAVAVVIAAALFVLML